MDKNTRFREKVKKTEVRLHWALAAVYIGLFGALVSLMPVRKEMSIYILVFLGFYLLAGIGWALTYATRVKLKEYIAEVEENSDNN